MQKIFLIFCFIAALNPGSAMADDFMVDNPEHPLTLTLEKAIAYSNPTVCTEMDKYCNSPSDCSTTLDSCYSIYSIKTQEPNACRFSSQPDACYEIYAFKIKDISACDFIKDSGNPDLHQYGVCVIGVQQEMKQFSLQNCLKLQEFTYKAHFLDCIALLVQQTKDASLCEYIKKVEYSLSDTYYQECLKTANSSK